MERERERERKNKKEMIYTIYIYTRVDPCISMHIMKVDLTVMRIWAVYAGKINHV